VAVALHGGPRGQAFLAHMQGWGARVVSMSAEEHDRAMAAVQVATHGAILAFGMALGASGYDMEKISAVTTPPHRLLLALLARIMSASPEVYWEIQTANPFADELRQGLAEAMGRLQQMVAGGDYDGFLRSFDQGRALFGSHGEEMARYCARLFELPWSDLSDS
jgi:4-amino-4-deoxyprephenate dehydrogenase